MLITCLSVPELYLPDFIVPRRFGETLSCISPGIYRTWDLNLGHNPIGYATGGVSCRIKLLVASEELFGSTKRDVSELGLLVQPLAVPWGCSGVLCFWTVAFCKGDWGCFQMARDKGRGGIFKMDCGAGMFVCCNWIRRGGSVIGGVGGF